MAAKRISPDKKRTRRKAAAKAAPVSTAAEAVVVLHSKQAVSGIPPELRRQLVAAEAYFRAERRGFAAGNELDDWVAAESAVDSRLQQQVA